MKKFKNTLDYSLELIKLREVYRSVFRNSLFSFSIDGKEYSQQIINVTFKYAHKEFNKAGKNIFVREGYLYRDLKFEDCVCICNGKIVGIELNKPVSNAVSLEMLEDIFEHDGESYILTKESPTLVTKSCLREQLYKNGFVCDGITYVRYKRSSGSSRVGKCLFVNKALQDRMQKYERCGIKVRGGDKIDLAAFESYISLPLSSIIDTIDIEPKNILVIDDYKSGFTDDVVAVRYKNGSLIAKEEAVEIKNDIWDGQSLLDVSMFGEYSKYGCLLLRNRFFKSCCFNTNLQKYFKDNNITEVSQLNGFTLAKDLSDIKLVTTANSIKYLKFGTLKQWLDKLDKTFGVVKHEKPTAFFDGQMVQMHYQLLNTLRLSYEQVCELLHPSLEYMKLLKTDPAVLMHHIKYPENYTWTDAKIDNKNDIVYRLLGINSRFHETKIYYDFVCDLLKAYMKNLRKGHILISGNYSTLFGNPLEMLKQTVGKFDGVNELGVGNIYSKRFKNGETLISSRSPHITMANVWLPHNTYNAEIDIYFNLTNEIVCINAIGENIMERLNGCDYDSDAVLLSDNKILINAAKKNYNKFKVPTNMVDAKNVERFYTDEQKSDLDIKTSVNKIGEIVNLSQDLNSLFWDRVNNGETIKQNKELYLDICILAVLSCIEIDRAKKEFEVDSNTVIKSMKKKYKRLENAENRANFAENSENPTKTGDFEQKSPQNRTMMPYFFGVLSKIKKYDKNPNKKYIYHKTSMDYLQKRLNCFRLPNVNVKELKDFSHILDMSEYSSKNINYRQAEKIKNTVENMRLNMCSIWSNKHVFSEDDANSFYRHRLCFQIQEACAKAINSMSINKSTIIYLMASLNKPDNSRLSKYLFNTFFANANMQFYELIKNSIEKLDTLHKNSSGNLCIFNEIYAKIKAK